ncbi:hypothetical protein NQV05_02165 [Mycoplasmopsis agalactiae]|uniref:Mbov_0392 family ICE element protein n=1 Tax=Mycoplasmopsis agalactiae TaxID=2110 RepID=UPI00211C1399|nr:hypothetical protein [Mycoplasmopsis agalactiae]UUM25188.1 hypothetical protein NQV05_02165 [Mycoplasmopsis agalactiae]
MKKYFETEDIKNFFPNKELLDTYEKNFNQTAASLKKKERKTYIQLVKDIAKNINDDRYFSEEFKIETFFYLIDEKLIILNQIAQLYSLTKDIAENGSESKIKNLVLEENKIYSFDDLWKESEQNLSKEGIKGNIKLAYDLMQLRDKKLTENWIKFNFWKDPEIIEDLDQEVKEWLTSEHKSYEDMSYYGSTRCLLWECGQYYKYSLEDYLEEKQSEELAL